MPKYYCDYCDIFLTHDSPSVRKSHNDGWKHKAAVRDYYQQFEEEYTQHLIEQKMRAEYEASKMGRPNPFQQAPPMPFPGAPGMPPGFRGYPMQYMPYPMPYGRGMPPPHGHAPPPTQAPRPHPSESQQPPQ